MLRQKVDPGRARRLFTAQKGAPLATFAAFIIKLHILTSFDVILNGKEVANYYFSRVVPPLRALPAPFGWSHGTFLV